MRAPLAIVAISLALVASTAPLASAEHTGPHPPSTDDLPTVCVINGEIQIPCEPGTRRLGAPRLLP